MELWIPMIRMTFMQNCARWRMFGMLANGKSHTKLPHSTTRLSKMSLTQSTHRCWNPRDKKGGLGDSLYTINDNEAENHLLKLKTDRKRVNLVTLIKKSHELVKEQSLTRGNADCQMNVSSLRYPQKRGERWILRREEHTPKKPKKVDPCHKHFPHSPYHIHSLGSLVSQKAFYLISSLRPRGSCEWTKLDMALG